MKESQGPIKMNYNAQIATTEEQLIVAADVITNPGDRKGLIPMIEATEQNTGNKVKEVYADAGYSSFENYREIGERKIDAYIPDQEYEKLKEHSENPYDKQYFQYDGRTDSYRCPQGWKLIYFKTRHDRFRKNLRFYKSKSCPGCAYRQECTTAKYRTITRHTAEHIQDSIRKKLATADGKKKYSKRKVMVEPVFGHIKKNLGFRQFLLRGIEKVKNEFRILCASYNIMKLHKWKLAHEMT
jgi:transposase